MSCGVKLPSEPKALANVVRSMLNRGLTIRNPLWIEWTVNYWYMQGARRFNVRSWRTGDIITTYESYQGQLRFKYEDVLEQYNRELGQLLRINVTPKVEARRKMDLDGTRKAVCGQLFLDNLLGPLPTESLKRDLLEGMLMFGMMGLGCWANLDASLMMDAVIETIPPWQIVPMNSALVRAAEARGDIRHRWVPYEAFRERWKGILKFPKDDSPEHPNPLLNMRWVSPGQDILVSDNMINPSASQMFGIQMGAQSSPMYPGSPEPGVKTDEPFVEVIEGWVPNHKGELLQAFTLMGDYVGRNVSFEDLTRKPVEPLAIARAQHSGSYFGRSWLGPLISLNNEAERMYSQLFKNVQEMDQFPILLLPANQGIQKQHLESTSRPRVAFYERDLTGEKLQFEKIEPVTTTDFPGKVAASVLGLMDRQGRNSPMSRGDVPGRIESAVGLSFLYETGNVSRNPLLESLDRAYSQVYKCLLSKGRDLLGGTPNLKLLNVDDALAGLSVDPRTGDLQLDELSALPNPEDVIIHIKEREPKLSSVRKQELLLMFQQGLLSAQDFMWKNYVEDLGFPVSDTRYIEQRKLCMWRNIVQFNDGKTPRGVVLSEHDDHQVQVEGIMAFMSRSIYHLSDPAVQEMFEQRLQYHQQMASGQYPDPLEHPEDMGAAGPGIPPQLQNEVAKLRQKAMGPMAQPA